MNPIVERLRAGFDQLAAVVPAFFGSLLILVAGYFIAKMVERWTDSLLKRLNFNKMAEAGGISEAVGGPAPVSIRFTRSGTCCSG